MPYSKSKSALLLTTALLVLVNLVPVVGVLLWGWSVYTLVLLFWAENLIVGAFNVARFWVLWRYRNDSKMIFMIPFFCLHFGIFMLVHLMFLIWMFRPEGESIFPLGAIWVPFLALVASHGVSFFTHFVGRGEYREARPDRLMTQPYARVLVLHVTILVGGLLVAYLDEPLAALLVLVGAKILIDVAAHRREHRRHLTEATVNGETGRDRDFPDWGEPAVALAGDAPATVPEPDDLMQAIRSELGGLKAEHDRCRATARRDIAILAAGGLVIAVLLVALTDAPLVAGLFTGALLATVLGLFRVHNLREGWARQVIGQLLPTLCEHAGGLRYESAMKRAFVKPFEKLELIGDHWTTSRFGPFFRGRYAATDFEFGQAALTRQSGGKNSSTEEIFKGLLFRIRLPFEVEDRVLVAGKSLFSGKRHMVNVDLDDEPFHDIFAVHVAQDHSDPEGLARSVLGPEWRVALADINRSHSGGAGRYAAIQAAFMHDSLYLTLRRFSMVPTGQHGTMVHRPGREYFQMPLKLFSEPDIEKDLRGLIDDLLVAHRIVEKLPTPRSSGQSE